MYNCWEADIPRICCVDARHSSLQAACCLRVASKLLPELAWSWTGTNPWLSPFHGELCQHCTKHADV